MTLLLLDGANAEEHLIKAAMKAAAESTSVLVIVSFRR